MVFKANAKLFNYICQFWSVNHVSVKTETCLYSHSGCMPHCLFISFHCGAVMCYFHYSMVSYCALFPQVHTRRKCQQ